MSISEELINPLESDICQIMSASLISALYKNIVLVHVYCKYQPAFAVKILEACTSILFVILYWIVNKTRPYSNRNQTKQQTPWSESASELYQLKDSRLSAKLMPTFADIWFHVVSVTAVFSIFLDRHSNRNHETFPVC
jgi:hypothetical protein